MRFEQCKSVVFGKRSFSERGSALAVFLSRIESKVFEALLLRNGMC